jgi:hypothetical protein
MGLVTKLFSHVSLISQKLLQLIFWFFQKHQKARTQKKTIAKSKAKENLTKLKNLQVLPWQRCQKTFLMAGTLFLKIPLIRTPSIE